MKKGRKKHAHEKEPNLERWLVSYADFITLLFAVFTTLYAMSVTDDQKVEEVKKSIQNAFGYSLGFTSSSAPVMNVIESTDFGAIPEVMEAAPPAPEAETTYADVLEFARIREEVKGQLASFGVEKDVKITINERGLVISLKEAGFFASGSATLQQDALPLLDRIAASLAGQANTIRVEGHTDNVPVRSQVFASNWELSTSRATNVVRYLIDRHQFKGNMLSATGYGEYHPVADNKTEAGRRQNRRVDIVMLSRKAAQAEPR